MALKKLMVALRTTRPMDVGGKTEDQPVRFAAGAVVDLTDSEMELLEKLQTKTGKLHYRDPIQEGGAKIVASEPEIVDVPDYAGQDVAMGSKDVPQLKAYLTFHSVEFKGNASKADLLDLATKHEAGQTDDKSGGSDGAPVDPDGGL